MNLSMLPWYLDTTSLRRPRQRLSAAMTTAAGCAPDSAVKPRRSASRIVTSRGATASPSVAAQPALSPEALARAARLTSRVLCECPRHLAELIQLLGDFEDYSARCAVDTPADRRLHDELGRTAALARQRFEQALRRIAAEEGWQLDVDDSLMKA